MKDGKMKGASGTHGRDEKCIKNFVGNLKGTDHSEDLGVDGGKVCTGLI
jgi:hypothetical protein